VGVIKSSVEAMTAGNILVGGVIGLGVNAMSGAINKNQRPLSRCGQSRTAKRRPAGYRSAGGHRNQAKLIRPACSSTPPQVSRRAAQSAFW
jgi:hypothetical protein